MSQRVLITAGAGGIGLVIAKAFIANGARVHIIDINQQAVQEAIAQHSGITGTVGDISRPGDLDTLFRDVEEHLGGIDVSINNAGIAGATVATADYPMDAWQAVVDINLTGTFMVTQRAIPLLKASGAGAIIVMSSVAGRFGYADRIAYATTKWGLVGFTKTLSLELGSSGITANSIHPGAVACARIEAVFEGRAKVSGRSVEGERRLAMDNQAVKKFVDPEDIAQLALFLAGPHARSISGQVFPIDGDSKGAS